MSTTSTDAAWSAVRTAEPAALSRDGCEELLVDLRRVRSWLDSVEMATARRVRELADVGRAEAPGTLVAAASGRTGSDARDVEQRNDLCDQAPTLGDALAEGDVTAKHLDAINRAATGLPDDVRAEFLGHSDDLLVRAKQVGLEAFGRECRQLAKHLLAMSRRGLSDSEELEAQRTASKLTRWVDKVTGMHHTMLELDPVRDARLRSTFNAALARLRSTDGNKKTPWQQLQVEAFLDALAGDQQPAMRSSAEPHNGVEAGSNDAGSNTEDAEDRGRRIDRIPEIVLHISYEWLIGAATNGICETDIGIPIPISTARRMCCDAEIIPVLLGTDGEVLDQGRSARTANRAQRRAMRTMHRGCAFPGCQVGFDACRIHHVKWWWRDNGSTDIDNMLPVCERHHHLLHEGGWGLTLHPDRTATWWRPDGTEFHTGTTISRTPENTSCSATACASSPPGSPQPT